MHENFDWLAFEIKYDYYSKIGSYGYCKLDNPLRATQSIVWFARPRPDDNLKSDWSYKDQCFIPISS